MIGYFLLAAVWVALDQGVKLWVRGSIPLHTTLPFLPGFDLTCVRNTGAAFSILTEQTWILTVLSAAVSVVLAAVLLRRILPRPGQLALALLLGGAVGNLIDRASLGYVTDMFRTTFVDFPVFNVADIGVVLGAALLCLTVLLTGEKGEKKP